MKILFDLRRWAWRSMSWLIPAVVLVFALGLKATQIPLINELRDRVFDTYQSIKPREYRAGTSPIRIVDIDDQSLERVGQWPWSRRDIAELIKNLSLKGAGLIVFDVVFAEPDRTSLEQIVQRIPDSAEASTLKDLIEKSPTNDQFLADFIKRSGRVITGFTFQVSNGNGDPIQKKGIPFAGDNPANFLRPYEHAIVNLKEFDEAAVGVGSFTVQPDRDGIIRRIPVLFSYKGKLFPSLAAESLRVAQGQNMSIRVKSSGASGMVEFGGGERGIDQLRIGNMNIPTDQFGHIMLYDSGSQPSRYVPAWKAVDGSIRAEDVSGRIVLVGTSAAGLKDIRTTPLEPLVAGVEVHAQLIEQVVSGIYLNRPLWANGLELVYMFVLGTVVIVLGARLSAGWSALVGLLAVATAIGVSWYAFDQHLMLLDPVFPSVTGLAVWIVGSALAYIQVEAERAEVRGAFGRYLSPALVERLAGNPDQLKLGGEMRDLTLLFCDIRGFTPISEQFDPEGLTRFINRFLTPMTEIILKYQGTIDKYMGDCIMAFWNAPLDVDGHERLAIDSALDMIERLKDHNAILKQEAEDEDRKFLPINIGIGLNTGGCCVGNMGSDQRFDYSVLGDSVNLASRLEGQSKPYGVTIVIGESTYKSVQDYACLDIDKIRVKGKTIPVQIYTVLGGPDMANDADFQTWKREHNHMMAAYRAQDWDTVQGKAQIMRDAHPEVAKMYELYLDRAVEYRENSPGADWDGVFSATSK